MEHELERERESLLTEAYNAHELAALFTLRSGESLAGPRYVDAHLVKRWYHTRDKTGFPEALPDRRPEAGHRPVLVWDAEAAWAWFRGYTPSRGGAPRGNGNARMTDGRYVGVRARRREQTEPAVHSC